MLQNPHFSYELNLPIQVDPPKVTKELNIVTADQLSEEVRKVVKRSFFKALEKAGLGKFRDAKSEIYRFNIFNSNTDRFLHVSKTN